MSNTDPDGDAAFVQVPCIRLDDLLPTEPIGLLKVDVEGFELKVLRGSSALLQRCRPLLYLENDRMENSPELIKWLWQAGYDLWWHIPPIFNPLNYFGVAQNLYGRVSSLNMLGVPKEVRMEVPAHLVPVKDSSFHPLRAPIPRVNISTSGTLSTTSTVSK